MKSMLRAQTAVMMCFSFRGPDFAERAGQGARQHAKRVTRRARRRLDREMVRNEVHTLLPEQKAICVDYYNNENDSWQHEYKWFDVVPDFIQDDFDAYDDVDDYDLDEEYSLTG